MIKLVLLTVALLLGCSKGATSDDLDCSAVSDKVVEIIKADMGKLPEAQRKALEAQLATIRSELIEDCRKDPAFFEPKADCIMKAKSSKDLESCESAAPKPANDQK